MPKIKNLVFQGGGVKGSAYAGAVGVLAEHGLLADIDRIAGTSAGAITACLLACGAGTDGLTDAIRHTDFGSFLDTGWNVFDDAQRLWTHYGVCKGDHFQQLLGDRIERLTGHRDFTFGQLREASLRDPAKFSDLFVVASNISKQRSEVLCAANHPDMPLWLAVRTSMSMPFIFEPVNVKGDYYVDGGITWNYAIDLFDHPDATMARPGAGLPRSDETLGFVLQPQAQALVRERDWSSLPAHTDSLMHFASSVMGFMSEAANELHLHEEDVARTVFINDLDVQSTDFKAPASVIEALIAEGEKATRDYVMNRLAVVIA